GNNSKVYISNKGIGASAKVGGIRFSTYRRHGSSGGTVVKIITWICMLFYYVIVYGTYYMFKWIMWPMCYYSYKGIKSLIKKFTKNDSEAPLK
ncbi:MAG: hypothetical protein K2G70_06650, partial [Turicibacter sp.]|nr:hypothetical protein [Turicibacter sp.]